MKLRYDFSGWATRNDLVCADGRTIRQDAFKDCDGKMVPLVWNHQHNNPTDILGHALLENRQDGVYAYCTFNESEAGRAGKLLVQHGDVEALSIYANQLKQQNRDVVHGVIREVSLVVAGANPGARIDFVDMAHGEGGEQEVIIKTGESISLYHADDGDDDGDDGSKSKENPKDDGEGGDTLEAVVDSMSEEQKKVMYGLLGAALASEPPKGDSGSDDKGQKKEEPDDKTVKHSEGGDSTMKRNVFDKTDDTQDTVLSHSIQEAILADAKKKQYGTFQTALKSYVEQNSETLKHGIDDIESLFPEYKDLRPGAPELVTRDQGWVTTVMNKVHKSPISRIRTRQMDARNDEIRAHGYQKGKRKVPSGNMKLIKRTTDPQTIYITDAMNRDDIIDITDFDVVEYQYAVMRENINEDVATAIMVGDGREPDDEMKISEDHIRSIWNDNDLYTIHYDVDIEAAKAELQGSKTSMSFGENYIYAEAVIAAALYAREKYKGTGTPDFFCTPHMVNVMLLARDMNGRRIYTSKADLAAALNVGELYTAEQFEGLVRMDDEGHKHKLLGIFVNLTDYTVGSTKGGEITRFDQFDIDFNQQKYLIETRLSGALTRVYSAIALEEPVAAFTSGGTGGDGGGAGTP